MSESLTIKHITITVKGDRIDCDCSICGLGMDVGATFGPIPGDILIAEWVKQHTHKPKAKRV